MPPAVSVVVPLYRTGEAVAELVGRLREALAGEAGDVEILLVDDASPDDTLARARAVADAGPGVRVIALPANVGQHRAILAGMAEATGERVVVMDGDLQDPPEAVPALLAKAREGWEVVFAARRGEWQAAGRMRTSRLFKTLLGAMTGIPADCGTFFVAGRTAVGRALEVAYRRPWVVTMVGAGERIATVPVVREVRPRGRSAYSGGMRLAAALSALAFTVRWRLGSGDGDPPARGGGGRFALMALLFAVPSLLAAFALPFSPGDEGYHLEVADAIRLGGVPGRDIELVRYLPGPFLPIAAVHALAGPSVIGPRLLFALVSGAVAALAVSLLRRLSVAAPIAVVAGALLAIVPGPVLKGYVPLAALLLLSGLLSAAGGAGTFRLGVAAGIALALRIDAGLLALVLSLAVLAGRRMGGRRAGLLPWAFGAALALLPPVAFVVARGGAASLVAPYLQLARAAAGVTAPGLALPFPGGVESPRAMVAALVHGGAVVPVLLLGALVVARWSRREGRTPEAPFAGELLLLAVSAAHVPAWLLERPDASHLAIGAFSFLLPAAVVVDRALRPSPVGPPLPVRRSLGRFVAAALALHALAWSARELPNGDGGSLPLARPGARPVRFEGIRGPVPIGAGSRLPAVVEEVRRRTPGGEPIAVFPFAPGIAFLARRPLAGPQRFLAPHNAGPRGEALALEAIARARVVVVNPSFDYGAGGAGRLPVFAPRVAAEIARRGVMNAEGAAR